MKFPNAFDGVKKLFLSEIFQLIGTGLMLIAAFSALGTAAIASTVENADNITNAQAAGVVGGVAGLAIFGFIGLAFALVAFILQILGLNRARQDEPAFKTAFIFVFVGIACSLIGSFVPGTFGAIIRALSQLAGLAVTIFIIQGIINLANQLGDKAVASKGKTILYCMAAAYVIAFIASLISVFTSGAGNNVAGILAIVAYIINVVTYIIFLVYLNQAKKMLA